MLTATLCERGSCLCRIRPLDPDASHRRDLRHQLQRQDRSDISWQPAFSARSIEIVLPLTSAALARSQASRRYRNYHDSQSSTHRCHDTTATPARRPPYLPHCRQSARPTSRRAVERYDRRVRRFAVVCRFVPYSRGARSPLHSGKPLPEFPLAVTIAATTAVRDIQHFETANVVAALEGSDPKLRCRWNLPRPVGLRQVEEGVRCCQGPPRPFQHIDTSGSVSQKLTSCIHFSDISRLPRM